jgi:hypothetical protein
MQVGLKNYLNNIRHKLLWATGFPQEVHQMILESTRADTKSGYVDRGTQQLLASMYRSSFEKSHHVFGLDEVEFRNYSQNGEDGILWYIFSLLGTVNKRCVEICAGDGIECNSANLIINHGWTGLLFDGDEGHIKKGREYYGKHPDTFIYPPKLVQVWITVENVNQIITSNGFNGEIDLLSLDLDGVDYWIWNAIEAISPRVVVAETQAIWGCESSVTVPYRPDFKTECFNGFGIYSGASLPAFVKLGKKKGYRLVGCQRYGFNAFFVRDDVGQDIFPEIAAASCFSHPFAVWAHDELLPNVRNCEWQQV